MAELYLHDAARFWVEFLADPSDYNTLRLDLAWLAFGLPSPTPASKSFDPYNLEIPLIAADVAQSAAAVRTCWSGLLEYSFMRGEEAIHQKYRDGIHMAADLLRDGQIALLAELLSLIERVQTIKPVTMDLLVAAGLPASVPDPWD